MSTKDNSIYIEHMLDCIHRISEYVENKEQFYDSTLVQDAVVRNLQTMAESSKRLAISIKNVHQDIPWNNIAGFRNILVHDYLGVDLDMIWSVIEKELPTLEKMLTKLERYV